MCCDPAEEVAEIRLLVGQNTRTETERRPNENIRSSTRNPATVLGSGLASGRGLCRLASAVRCDPVTGRRSGPLSSLLHETRHQRRLC